jgi:hypothetical protein
LLVTNRRLPCVYCCEAWGVENEHVFPASWNPDDRPPGFQPVTVPSCGPCNDRWQKVEESVRGKLITVCNPEHSEAKGIFERVSRGWDRSRGKNDRDAARREREGRRLISSMLLVPPHPDRAQETIVLPDGSTQLVGLAREVDGTELNALAEKFVRGLHYSETGKLLKPFDVAALLLSNEHLVPTPGSPPLPPLDPSVVGALSALRMNTSLAPGLRYGREYFRDRKRKTHLWVFLIWGHVEIVAVVVHRMVELA